MFYKYTQFSFDRIFEWHPSVTWLTLAMSWAWLCEALVIPERNSPRILSHMNALTVHRMIRLNKGVSLLNGKVSSLRPPLLKACECIVLCLPCTLHPSEDSFGLILSARCRYEVTGWGRKLFTSQQGHVGSSGRVNKQAGCTLPPLGPMILLKVKKQPQRELLDAVAVLLVWAFHGLRLIISTW